MYSVKYELYHDYAGKVLNRVTQQCCFYVCSIMKDLKGRYRGRCTKQNCDCDEYQKEKDLCLCAYCEHTTVAHGMFFVLNLQEAEELSVVCVV